jgi:cellobiose phosphorylase
VRNPDRVCKGVKSITVDGRAIIGSIVPYEPGGAHRVIVVMGG